MFVDGDHFVHLMDTRIHQISSYRKLDNDCFIVSLRVIPEEIHSANNGNLAIATYITSHARLRLYAMLEASRSSALYNDTGLFFFFFFFASIHSFFCLQIALLR